MKVYTFMDGYVRKHVCREQRDDSLFDVDVRIDVLKLVVDNALPIEIRRVVSVTMDLLRESVETTEKWFLTGVNTPREYNEQLRELFVAARGKAPGDFFVKSLKGLNGLFLEYEIAVQISRNAIFKRHGLVA